MTAPKIGAADRIMQNQRIALKARRIEAPRLAFGGMQSKL
jgi:hypothetical protein